MRYLVLSDIHANLEALDAALDAAPEYDSALVLGDLVGYGADPNAVIDRIRGLRVAGMIRGNHDKVAAGIESVEGFNQVAREAVEWTASVLTPDNRAWLAALRRGPIAIDELVEICHGSPLDEDTYVFDDLDALRGIRAASRPVCLFGHTHVPSLFRLTDDPAPAAASPRGALLESVGPPKGARFSIDLKEHARYLINCGAVGQPRDGDPRAAYGIVDTEARTVVAHRTGYDITAAQVKIVNAGLPEILARRLAIGR